MPVLHLLNNGVSVSKRTGADAWGKATYGAATNEKARIEWLDREMRLSPDQMIKISARLFMNASADVDPNDRITMEGVNYRVVKAEKPPRVTGIPDHLEVLVSEES